MHLQNYRKTASFYIRLDTGNPLTTPLLSLSRFSCLRRLPLSHPLKHPRSATDRPVDPPPDLKVFALTPKSCHLQNCLMLLIFYSVIILNTCLFQYVYDGNAKASLKQLYSFALCCKKYFTVDSSSCDFKVTFVIFPFFSNTMPLVY